MSHRSHVSNPSHRRIVAAVAAAILGMALAMPAAADPITDDNVDQMVAAAKTPADHQALAAFFKAKAKAADDGARRHRAMLAADTRKPPAGNLWKTHCQRLIKSFEEQKADYLALAADQEQMAQAAAK